jgi:hypothetical protein
MSAWDIDGQSHCRRYAEDGPCARIRIGMAMEGEEEVEGSVCAYWEQYNKGDELQDIRPCSDAILGHCLFPPTPKKVKEPEDNEPLPVG